MPDKERERRYLKALQQCIDDLPKGEATESESPDFLIGSRPRRVGLEFTEYHHPPPPGERPYQETQSLKDRVVDLAEQLHHQVGGPALYVAVIFGPHGRLSKETVGPLAKALAEAVLSQDAPQSTRAESVNIPRDVLPREIARVRIHGSVDGEDKLWTADAGGWVAQIASADVQREIVRKQRVSGVAREKCDALWLVIVQNLVRGAPSELSEEAKAATYVHNFRAPDIVAKSPGNG